MSTALVNIGNTRLVWGSAPVDPFSTAGLEYRPTAEFRGRGARALWSQLCAIGASAVRISCVVPEIRRALEEFSQQAIAQGKSAPELHFIGAADYPEIDFSFYDIDHLGADRIANIAALCRLEPKEPSIAIDCGTAINTVAVDGPARRFCGGVILPGRLTSRRALYANTAQLPQVLPGNDPSAITPFGGDTASGIASGVDLAIAGALERICMEAGRADSRFAQAAIYLCGGDARFLGEMLKNSAVAHRLKIAPALTLFGI